MLALQHVSFAYHRGRPVFEDLSFELKTGNVYGVLGSNGSGKTTLLNLMAGLSFPDSGKLSFEGMEPRRRNPSFLDNMFYVPVDFQLPNISIFAFKTRFAHFYPRFDEGIWSRALKTFDLDVRQAMGQLSFGQRKKVLISFALSSGCALLLLDEPTDGLDIPSKDAFRRLLGAHLEDKRMAIITTHHVHDLQTMLDHILILREKSMVLNASIRELARKLRTSVSSHAPVDALYCERCVEGFQYLIPNKEQSESSLELELLFKAVMSNPSILNEADHAGTI
jgi:ABC-2 type transport system ATP-binding protein